MTVDVAESGLTGLVNIGSGEARTWLDLVRPIFAALNVPESIEFIEMPEQLRSKYQYSTCARHEKVPRHGLHARDDAAQRRCVRLRSQLSSCRDACSIRPIRAISSHSPFRRGPMPDSNSRARRRQTTRGGQTPPPQRRDPMTTVYISVAVILVLLIGGLAFARWQQNRAVDAALATPSPAPIASGEKTPAPVQLADGSALGAA